jgi:hypothetical protein
MKLVSYSKGCTTVPTAVEKPEDLVITSTPTAPRKQKVMIFPIMSFMLSTNFL